MHAIDPLWSLSNILTQAAAEIVLSLHRLLAAAEKPIPG
jgi:hypothetical protein